MFTGPKITLDELLDSREVRAFRQKEWLVSHSTLLICFTVNMMGEVKKNQASEMIFYEGLVQILNKLITKKILAIDSKKWASNTGFDLFVSVDTNDVLKLKSAMVEIEESHPLGRLFDIDVIDLDGRPVSRINLKLPVRRCLVCSQEAKSCARSQRHSHTELMNKISELVYEYSQ